MFRGQKLTSKFPIEDMKEMCRENCQNLFQIGEKSALWDLERVKFHKGFSSSNF